MKFIIHPKRTIRNLGVGYAIYGKTILDLTEDQVRYCLKYGGVETMNGINVTLENISEIFNPDNGLNQVNTFSVPTNIELDDKKEDESAQDEVTNNVTPKESKEVDKDIKDDTDNVKKDTKTNKSKNTKNTKNK